MDELETGFMFQKDELEVKLAAMEEREKERRWDGRGKRWRGNFRHL